MPALPPPKSSTIFSPNSGRQNGKGLLDQSISAPPPVPSGETEAQGRRDGGEVRGGYMLVKDLPLNLSLPPSLLSLPQCPWGGVGGLKV